MIGFDWDPKKGLCPFSCKKYKNACYDRDVALLAAEKLSDSRKELLCAQKSLESLLLLARTGYQIIGTAQDHDSACVVFMDPVNSHKWEKSRTVWLHKMPFQHRQEWVCFMSLDILPNCQVHIHELQCRYPNKGYGSILMTQLIQYLRTAGFRTLTGAIVPTDYEHEKKLRHFYSKFGFQITDFPDRRALVLDLYTAKTSELLENGCTVCCRSDSYQSKEIDILLADTEKKKPCSNPDPA